MKTRKTPVIALTLIVIGLVVCIVSFGFGFGFGNSNKNYETQTFTQIYDRNAGTEDMHATNFSFENIDFDIDCGNIKIIEGDSFELKVKDAIVDTVEEHVKNKTLTVTQNNPKNLKYGFNISFFGHSINNNNSLDTTFILTIPKGTEFYNINFKIDVGNIDTYELNCRNFSCDIDVGEVSLDNLTCEKTKIDSDVASINLKNARINDCDITSDIGKVDIQGIITGTNTFSTNIGDLELDLDGDITNYSFSVDKGIGDAEINNKKASLFENENALNTFDIKHDIGDVDITIG